MLAIRIPGTKLKTARKLLGWSLQETAARSSVNWLTIKRYEGAGKHLPSGTVVALNRLVATFENAGIRFDADDAYLDQAAPTIKSTILNDGAAL